MPGVFISYRRQDSAGHAGRLFDRLLERLGREGVFMDVAGIDAGIDFVHTLNRAVGSCQLLLAVIGPDWLKSVDSRGRRLDDPADFVRIEISAALQRDIPVIPVLVGGASLPSAELLPADLASLARRQAVELRDARWDSDTTDLVGTIERHLGLQSVRGSNWRRKRVLAVAAAVAAVAVAVSATLYRREPATQQQTAQPAAAALAEPELALTYAITVRPNSRQDSGSAPMLIQENRGVAAGDLVRFSFESPKAGFLYVLNESPPDANAESAFNILFPSPTSNGGSARLPAGMNVLIPAQGDGFEVDAEEGAERLWLVWSMNAINELDAVGHWANPRDRGEIRSAHDTDLVRSFLKVHASPAPQVEQIEGTGTRLTSRGQLLVKLVTLEHRR
jgi:TIR domain/Domain of unknown function (DUF4384)